jgi:iron complex transport system ATP-binding protein
MTSPLLHARVAHPPRLQPTELVAEAGERIAVIGPNGSGKTSLLRALAGIDPVPRPRGGGDLGRRSEPSTPGVPACAETRVLGRELASLAPAQRRRLLAFLPASRDVHWPIPVRDVIALGLDSPDPARVTELLLELRLERLAERAIDTLSTGERARVLLARALASRPQLLLLDEPLSNLDPAWVLLTLELLAKEAERGAALLVSLHDLHLVRQFDRVLVMDAGALRFDGEPEAFLRSTVLGEVFGVEPDGIGWRLSSPADRQSSP